MTESINLIGIPAPFTVTFTPPDSQQYAAVVSGLSVTFAVVVPTPTPTPVPPTPTPTPTPSSGNKKIAIVDYHYHNDNNTNSDMTAILAAKPDILIDNTPGGLYKAGTLPSKYASAGIKVFSYITGGYEGTEYKSSEDNLTSNIARVDAIALDKAAGVFIDEVSSFPNAAAKAYLTSLCTEAHNKGLLVMVNPGDNQYDDWLYSVADIVCSNEAYNGGSPSASEKGYLARTLVLDLNSGSTASSAITITKQAFANGYGWAFVTNDYNNLPPWLATYIAGL